MRNWAWLASSASVSLLFADVIASDRDARAVQRAVIAPAAIFVEQCAEYAVGSGAVSQRIEPVEGYAVIPPGKGQQVVVGCLAEQHHLLPACRYYPRQRVVIEGIMRYALLVATCAEPYLMIGVSLSCGLYGLFQNCSVHIIL